MARTVVGGAQVKDGSIQRADLDVTTVGSAVIAKVVQGTNITISSTGGDSGTGDVTINAAQQVATTSSMLKGNGAGTAVAAVSGTDYSSPSEVFYYAMAFG
ncbi:hypothetical protein [Acinetobacter sp.]|uniref:hypothetical protein n=1 Tax=Acinetobacter sp. TaxID=472 RepID=UPI003750F43C